MKKIELNENEIVDDLEIKGYKIVQMKDGFKYGIDSVLLSDFAKNIKNGARVIDLGTGTGILSLLLCAKTELKQIVGVEVQPEVAKIAQKNVVLNELEGRYQVLNCNVTDVLKHLKRESFDVVISNPPYKKENSGRQNENEIKLISRHEIKASLEDFISKSFQLLKDNGKIFMVHRAERLVDIFYLMRKYRLEPKRIKFVYSNSKSECKLVLIEGVKNAKAFMKIEEPLIVYDDDGNYTDEILKIYGKI